ncbi:MAG: DUF365 domain-containing protein [Candidatus Bathyarchaeia archaeon]|jgi:hypothetical protein
MFNEGRTVFAKYTNMCRLGVNSKIVFYATGGTGVVGEGIIERIEKFSPEKAWNCYESRLFLDYEEYKQYTLISPIGKTSRPLSEITVFVLKKIKQFRTRHLTFKVTPSGAYLTKEKYLSIFKEMEQAP